MKEMIFMKIKKLLLSCLIVVLFVFAFSSTLKAEMLSKPWIGLQIGDLTQDLSVKYGYYPNMNGIFVHYVFPAGPAGRGGMESGDIIVAINGKDMYSPSQLANFIHNVNYKTTVVITVVRNSKKKDLNVIVINNPYNTPVDSAYGDEGSKPWFGVTLKNVTRDMADVWNFPVASGLLVLTVYEDSPAYISGIREGDIIVDVDGEDIKTYEELIAIVTPIKPGKAVLLGIWQDGKKGEVEVIF